MNTTTKPYRDPSSPEFEENALEEDNELEMPKSETETAVEKKEEETDEVKAQKLTEDFKNMNAWQAEMRRDPKAATENYYGSKRVFLESCKKLYPNEQVDPSQANTEIARSRERLEEMDLIPNLVAELGKYSRNIKTEQIQDPVEQIREIDRIIEPASRAVEDYLTQNPGYTFERESQLDLCFKEIYRLELLKEKLSTTLTAEQNQDLAQGKEEKEVEGGIEPAPGEAPDKFKERIKRELETNWERIGLREYFKKGAMDWLSEDGSGDLDWTHFGKDTEKSSRLSLSLKEIHRDYHSDSQIPESKDFDYQIRFNELLRQF